jgi:outer membrane lipoprotein-sorting protein
MKSTVAIICIFLALAYAGSYEEDFLESVKNYYLSGLPLEIEFSTIQKLSESDEIQEVKGIFYFIDTSSFKVDFPEEEILYDGEWLWSWDKQDDKVIVEEFDPQSSLRLLYDILNGNWDQFFINKFLARDSITEIHLSTQDKNSFFKSIILEVKKDSSKIQKTTYTDFQDNKVVITLEEDSPISMPDSLLFRIKNFSDKELIDLRP